jgi:CBS domain-containing protein
MDVAAFLGRYPPFEGLDPERLASVARAVLIEFFPAGETILDQGGDQAQHLYVIRSGAVEIVEDGRLVDLAGEGEVFGQLSLISGAKPAATVRAHEDTLCYLIGHEAATEALSTGAGLTVIGDTLRQLAGRRERDSGQADLSRVRVGSLIHRPPVIFPADGSVAEGARVMAQERISSLLVPGSEGLGILTDRDLRSRVLAAGRPPETTVAEVMTVPVRTVSPDTMAAEVLLAMLEGGFHHFPVVDRKGGLVGVVTDTDLLGLARQSPFALKSAIERSPDEASAIVAAQELPETAASLVEAGVDPVEVGHVVGVTIDALTRRLIDLAVASLGEPPVAWAWFALGSEARHEQALSTDQDHALAYEPEQGSRADIDPYFAALAEAVTSSLEAAGIPRCRGDVMAVHPSLRRSMADWVAQFHAWMSDPGIEGSQLTSIVFDYRRLAGSLEVEKTLDEVVSSAPERYPQFLRHLTHRALDLKPPTGFFRDFVVENRGDHAGRLDVKHGGIMIVTNLARAWAIRAGHTEKPTLDRLRVAADSGQITEEARQALEEAFRLLWQVRLDHQAAMVRAGEKGDDFVDPASLGPITRIGLKEAFGIIAREQRGLSLDLRVR